MYLFKRRFKPDKGTYYSSKMSPSRALLAAESAAELLPMSTWSGSQTKTICFPSCISSECNSWIFTRTGWPRLRRRQGIGQSQDQPNYDVIFSWGDNRESDIVRISLILTLCSAEETTGNQTKSGNSDVMFSPRRRQGIRQSQDQPNFDVMFSLRRRPGVSQSQVILTLCSAWGDDRESDKVRWFWCYVQPEETTVNQTKVILTLCSAWDDNGESKSGSA